MSCRQSAFAHTYPVRFSVLLFFLPWDCVMTWRHAKQRPRMSACLHSTDLTACLFCLRPSGESHQKNKQYWVVCPDYAFIWSRDVTDVGLLWGCASCPPPRAAPCMAVTAETGDPPPGSERCIRWTLSILHIPASLDHKLRPPPPRHPLFFFLTS